MRNLQACSFSNLSVVNGLREGVRERVLPEEPIFFIINNIKRASFRCRSNFAKFRQTSPNFAKLSSLAAYSNSMDSGVKPFPLFNQLSQSADCVFPGSGYCPKGCRSVAKLWAGKAIAPSRIRRGASAACLEDLGSKAPNAS